MEMVMEMAVILPIPCMSNRSTNGNAPFFWSSNRGKVQLHRYRLRRNSAMVMEMVMEMDMLMDMMIEMVMVMGTAHLCDLHGIGW